MVQTSLSRRQASHLFASLRTAFTPLTLLHAPLVAGHVPVEMLRAAGHRTKEPEEIWLLQQGVWHAAVSGIGTIKDEDMISFVDPFEAARSLLASVQSNVSGLQRFLDRIQTLPNGSHVLERCLREPVTRTVWLVRSAHTGVLPEPELDHVLDRLNIRPR